MARRTFVWLAGRKRPPSEYEELSTGIQWYTEPVARTELSSWRLDNTALQADWNAFRDPAGMYYRNYVVGQDAVEKQLDAVFEVARTADFVSALDPAWRQSLAVLVGGVSFAQWGVSMAMQHVMRFTLSPTVACAVQLEVMDKLRNAERDVEWFELLHPDSADDELHRIWDEHPALQPLRKYMEEILVEADWGQVIVGTNLVLLGLLEPFLRELYIKGGRAHGDFTTAALGTHMAKDAARQLAWTDAFLLQCADDEANVTVISDWVDRYVPAATEAIEALAAAYALDGIAAAAAATARAEALARLDKVKVKITDNVSTALASGEDLG